MFDGQVNVLALGEVENHRSGEQWECAVIVYVRKMRFV